MSSSESSGFGSPPGVIPDPIEHRFLLSDGVTLACKQWGVPTATSLNCFAVHGWLDSAASFDRLIPEIFKQISIIKTNKKEEKEKKEDMPKLVYSKSNHHDITHSHSQWSPSLSPSSLSKFAVSTSSLSFCFVCVDLVGHGQSTHLSPDAYYSLPVYALQCLEILVTKLGWNYWHLIGHSLGGAVITTLSACQPSSVLSLSFLDSVGPWTVPANHLIKVIQSYAKSRTQLVSAISDSRGERDSRRKTNKIYTSIDQATAAYTKRNPITAQSARLLVIRQTTPIITATSSLSSSSSTLSTLSSLPAPSASCLTFRHDSRLVTAGSVYTFDEEVALSMFQTIANTPVLLIMAINQSIARQIKEQDVNLSSSSSTSSSTLLSREWFGVEEKVDRVKAERNEGSALSSLSSTSKQHGITGQKNNDNNNNIVGYDKISNNNNSDNNNISTTTTTNEREKNNNSFRINSQYPPTSTSFYSTLARRVRLLNNVEVFTVQGYHHLHMDKANIVAKTLITFYTELETKQKFLTPTVNSKL